MNRIVLLFLVSVLGAADAQDKVSMSGISAAIKLEEPVSGNLTELNGKYKLRATEVTFAPGALLDAHHHAGPGLRRTKAPVRVVFFEVLPVTHTGPSVIPPKAY
jgi:hypothetical protein